MRRGAAGSPSLFMGTTPRHRANPVTHLLGVAVVVCLGVVPVPGQPAVARARYVRLDEVHSLLSQAAVPSAIRTADSAARGGAFDNWIRAKDAEIRARVLRADEDALVPLLLFGTSFTSAPRLTTDFFAAGRTSNPAEMERAFAAVFARRTDDLLSSLASAADDVRLSWARQTLARAGHSLRTAAGRAATGRYLVETFARVTRESETLAAGLKTGSASVDRAHAFAERALASDSGWPVNFAVSEALVGLRSNKVLTSVRRVGIVGPGLDNVDKDEGFDLYPPQSLQPFALLDALARLKLAPARLELSTFDLNPRVNQHLRTAQISGREYLLHLIAHDRPWTDAARTYWRGLGQAIGAVVPDFDPPTLSGAPDARAVRIPANVLQQLNVLEGNIVCERIDLPESAKLDLVVATNVLLYYDAVEQALAAANIAHLLRPGGVLLTNTRLTTVPPDLEQAGDTLTVFSSRSGDGEIVYAYRRPT